MIAQRTVLAGESFQLIMSLWIPFIFVEHVMPLCMEPFLIIRHFYTKIQNGLIDCSSISLEGAQKLGSETER